LKRFFDGLAIVIGAFGFFCLGYAMMGAIDLLRQATGH
jgi:hypothetical protein